MARKDRIARSACTGCASDAAAGSIARARYRLSDMDCPAEEALIRRHLSSIAGVVALEFDLAARTLTVAHSLPSLAAVETALESIGMKPQPASGVREAPEAVRYRIEKMDCASEERLIREKLAGMPGVRSLEFDLSARTLAVWHELPSTAGIEKALEQIGMPATSSRQEELRTAPPAQQSAAPKLRYRIENMDCPTEEALIRSKLGKLDGVKALEFDLVQRTLAVGYEAPSVEPIEQALAEIGMKAQRMDAGRGPARTVLKIEKDGLPD